VAVIDITHASDIDTVDAPDRSVLGEFRHFRGHTLEAALLCSELPPGSTLSVPMIRELLAAGSHLSGRVLRELVAGGVAVVRHIRDAAGRLLGRRTEWVGPGRAASVPESVPERVDEPTGRALALLRSLADVDERLTFAERELRTLAPLVLERLNAGDSEDALRRALSRDLPPLGRRLTTGLLHYRLTKGKRATPAVPAPAMPTQARPAVLVECDDCGHPGPTLSPGDLCDVCRRRRAGDPLLVADAPELPAFVARLRRIRAANAT